MMWSPMPLFFMSDELGVLVSVLSVSLSLSRSMIWCTIPRAIVKCYLLCYF